MRRGSEVLLAGVAFIAVALFCAVGVVGLVFLVGTRLSWLWEGSEYDFVRTTTSSGDCFRVGPHTVMVQIELESSRGKDLEVDRIALIDANGIEIDVLGLVGAQEPPLSLDEPVTREVVAVLTEPESKGSLDLTARVDERAFLLLELQTTQDQATASGVELGWVPGEPLLIDVVASDLKATTSRCTLTGVRG